MKRFPRLAALITAGLFTVACTVGPKYSVPTPPPATAWKEPPPDNFKEAKGWKLAQPADDELRPDWWTIFNDPTLNDLEAQVNVSNQNLKAAEARFRQARAVMEANHSALFPAISTGPAISANRSSLAKTLPGENPQYNDFFLPVDVNYEVDAWGRIRHNIEASREEAQATAGDLQTLNLSLHADLAYDYFEMRSAETQKKLLDATVTAYRKALELMRNLYEGGAAPAANVSQAEAQLEATETLDVDTGVERAQMEHALATLVGKAPSEFEIAPHPLDQSPPVIPGALPSQLLERRPDIASAERRVAEANAQMGIARAAYFPTIMLSAAAGFESGSIAGWFSWPNRLWAVGPQMLETIFDAGRRRANTEGASANYDAAVAGYRQAALDAFQQVEDNLAVLRLLEQETDTQRAAVRSADRSLELSMNQYKGGLITYLEVVTAQTISLDDQRAAVDILRRRMDASVLLIKALGGGWTTAQLPKMTR